MNYIIRDDKEHETTAPKVKVIAPRKKFQPSYNDRQNRKIRVGAYCRVSTDSDEQELSYETQCEYYENYIGSHENWELIAIYSDEGITGTSTNKRSDFMRMIDDARAGKLDMIITKSITRFARNTVDSLMYLRILKEYNVDVYFEVENVHSLEANEMLLTILSSVAQQSSEDKSESIKWGYQRQFEKGKVYAANMYGYKSNRGTLDIIEEEAEVVREIFSKYLSGMSESKIARYLTENKIPKKNGSTKWDSGTIGRMLQNEKYSGDALLKKTFSIDFLHKKRYKNEGQKKMYFVENSHPAIIEKEVFAQAEKLIGQKRLTGSVHSVYPLSKKLVCGVCGTVFRRKTSGREFDTTTWVCRAHYLNTEKCPMKPVTETEIHRAFCFLYNKLLLHKTVILEGLLQDLQEIKRRDQCSHPDVIMINRELLESLKQVHFLTQLHSKGVISADIYLERRTALDKKTTELQKKLLSSQQTNKLDEVIGQTEKLLSILYERTKF